jgi:hypothetical protein
MWESQFGAMPGPFFQMSWERCCDTWERRCKSFLCDTFSKATSASAAPTECRLAFQVTKLLLITMQTMSRQTTIPFDDCEAFEDTFTILHQQFPSTSFHDFSQLVVASFRYVQIHYPCLTENQAPRDRAEDEFLLLGVNWPRPSASFP